MTIQRIDASGATHDVQVGGPAYQHIMIGRTNAGCHNEGFVLAVRDLHGVTGPDNDGWRFYAHHYLVEDANILTAKHEGEDGLPEFIGGDDPVDWQIAVTLDGEMCQIGNRVNTLGETPITRVDPDAATVTFSRNNSYVDVTLN